MTDKYLQCPPDVAVVGCGGWGQELVRTFAGFGALGAVCDSDPNRAEAIAREFAVPSLDFEAVLASTSITAVAIATPPDEHALLIRRAIEAGKHILVERPFAMSVVEAEALCRLANAHQRTLMAGHLPQYHPAFEKLRDLIQSGELGRLQYVYSNRMNARTVRQDPDILWNFAPLDISMTLSLIGSEPDSVVAQGSKSPPTDIAVTLLSFPNGECAHSFVSWPHPFQEDRYVMVFEEGMVVFDDSRDWDGKLVSYPRPIDWTEGLPAERTEAGRPIPLDFIDPLAFECRHFIECFTNGAPSRTDGVEAVRVLKVLEMADESMRRKSSFSGQRRRFPGVMIHESSYVDDPCDIGEGTTIWHFSHILKNVSIGRNCNIGQNVVVGSDVTIGNNCRIQNNVSIYTGVQLEDGVFCGPSCVFTNVLTPRAEVNRKAEFLPTHVGRGASIGANATIVCGHRIGAYALIAAGAVVSRDVRAHALVAGVPARQIGWVSHSGDRLGSDLICPRTGRAYIINADGDLEEVTTGG